MTTHNDNTTLSSQSGGDEIRTIARTQDDGTQTKTQAVCLDVGGEQQELLVNEQSPMPVHDSLTYAKLCEIADYLARICAVIDA